MRPSISTSEFSTQADKIENLLRSRYGVWIPAYELADVALQYCARINAIRKKLRGAGDTEEIQNKTERVRGQVHGSYRICQKAPVSSFSAEKPSKSWAEVVAERNRKLAAGATDSTATDLPLFAGVRQ
jgi:hypothetical protein